MCSAPSGTPSGQGGVGILSVSWYFMSLNTMNTFLKEEKNQNPSTPTQTHGPGRDPKEQRPESSHVCSGAPDHILLWQKGKGRVRPYYVRELQGLSAAGRPGLRLGVRNGRGQEPPNTRACDLGLLGERPQVSGRKGLVTDLPWGAGILGKNLNVCQTWQGSRGPAGNSPSRLPNRP